MFQFSLQLLFEANFHDSHLGCAQKCHTGEWHNFMKNLNMSENYLGEKKTSKYKILFQSIQHFLSCYVQTDRLTDKEELQGAFLFGNFNYKITIYFSCSSYICLYQIIWSDSINPLATQIHFHISPNCPVLHLTISWQWWVQIEVLHTVHTNVP